MVYHALRDGDARPFEVGWQSSPSFRRKLQEMSGAENGERPLPRQGELPVGK